MNVKNSLYGAFLAAAMMVTMVPGKALARGGADDVIPGAGHPMQLAKGGADDAIPGAGHPVQRGGADDVIPGAGHPLA